MHVSPEVVPALCLVASSRDGAGLAKLRHSRGRVRGKYDLHCQRKGGYFSLKIYIEAILCI